MLSLDSIFCSIGDRWARMDNSSLVYHAYRFLDTPCRHVKCELAYLLVPVVNVPEHPKNNAER